jgi:hypothetical protein
MLPCFCILSLLLNGGNGPFSAAAATHLALFDTAFAEAAMLSIHFVRFSHLFGFIIQDCGQLPNKSQNAQGMSTIESMVE